MKVHLDPNRKFTQADQVAAALIGEGFRRIRAGKVSMAAPGHRGKATSNRFFMPPPLSKLDWELVMSMFLLADLSDKSESFERLMRPVATSERIKTAQEYAKAIKQQFPIDTSSDDATIASCELQSAALMDGFVFGNWVHKILADDSYVPMPPPRSLSRDQIVIAALLLELAEAHTEIQTLTAFAKKHPHWPGA